MVEVASEQTQNQRRSQMHCMFILTELALFIGVDSSSRQQSLRRLEQLPPNAQAIAIF